MTTAQASRAKLIAAFAAIYIIWGSTFLAIKYAIVTMPPFAMAAARFLGAGAILYVWSRLRKDVATTKRHWFHAFILGFLMLCLGNGAVVWAEESMPSGLVALIVAIIPLWVVLIDWLRPGGRRPHGAVLVGVVTGLIGMLLLIGPSALGKHTDIDLRATLVVLGGSVAWSVATVFGKRADVPGYPPITSAMQLLGGGACLVVVSILAGEPARLHLNQISLQGLIALAYLIVMGSVVAFSAYSWLMRVAPPARIATYAYVNPVVAMLLGWLVAGERLTTTTLLAAGVILGGVALITTGMNRS